MEKNIESVAKYGGFYIGRYEAGFPGTASIIDGNVVFTPLKEGDSTRSARTVSIVLNGQIIYRLPQMKKGYVVLAVAIAFVLGAAACCGLCCSKSKVAVVDIISIVSKSEQVQNLKAQQAAQTEALGQWLQAAQEEVNKIKDDKQKDEKTKQYAAEFAQKRDAVVQQYSAMLADVDKSITETIIKVAKSKGYKVVLPKNLVIYGSSDITEEVEKEIK
jgi:Skp family chaperone for outer membrane proteins